MAAVTEEDWSTLVDAYENDLEKAEKKVGNNIIFSVNVQQNNHFLKR